MLRSPELRFSFQRFYSSTAFPVLLVPFSKRFVFHWVEGVDMKGTPWEIFFIALDWLSWTDALMLASLLIASGLSLLYVVIQATYLINDVLHKGARNR